MEGMVTGLHTTLIIPGQRCSWPLTKVAFLTEAGCITRLYVDQSFSLEADSDDPIEISVYEVAVTHTYSRTYLQRIEYELRAIIPRWCPVMMESTEKIQDLSWESSVNEDYEINEFGTTIRTVPLWR
jgi:hypothetical protein